ncbi:MAG TPA: bifunctional pyr operon transcriptional regulator/uracil phosphoribosyltransferase PyrR [Chthoniobacteraceae bacterium]|jgi:pyrimidine operon attenuation protein/uracil phosphoribosyltransferase|nr:pyrR [Chthoniobacter sp.]HEV7867109.1 bifunctional pyr operon transcriptional regulator/uracil phosphoribosyltransferase PyrR [Chthoniobacteraceae bacterium]
MSEPVKLSKASDIPPAATLVLDGTAIGRALKRIAHEIIERNPDLTKVALIGIPSRGVEIAHRLAELIAQFEKIRPFTGAIDVSMHRDDFHTRRMQAVQPTKLPPDLAAVTLVLTDDVLFSGRTCRAAMDAISSFGRPAQIQYMALIDRGHRELPIRPDYVGKNLPTSRSERVFVRFENTDQLPDSVWVERERNS